MESGEMKRARFIGEYNHTIDPKNRVIIPAKFRDQLGDSFVVSAGLDGCLSICTMEKWDKFIDELYELPTNLESRKLQRYFMQNAAECEADKAGRIVIPQKLVALAGLTKDVVLVGMGNKIEVWDKDKYESGNLDDSIEDITEKISSVYNLHF